MPNHPSIPERFVDVWAAIQSIPKVNSFHPAFHPQLTIKNQAEGIIEDALRRAFDLAYAAKMLAEIGVPVDQSGDGT